MWSRTAVMLSALWSTTEHTRALGKQAALMSTATECAKNPCENGGTSKHITFSVSRFSEPMRRAQIAPFLAALFIVCPCTQALA